MNKHGTSSVAGRVLFRAVKTKPVPAGTGTEEVDR